MTNLVPNDSDALAGVKIETDEAAIVKEAIHVNTLMSIEDGHGGDNGEEGGIKPSLILGDHPSVDGHYTPVSRTLACGASRVLRMHIFVCIDTATDFHDSSN